MIPKEKAKELVNKFLNFVREKDFFGDSEEFKNAKQCALIAVDEILDLNLGLSNCDENNWDVERFYKEVKKQINKL